MQFNVLFYFIYIFINNFVSLILSNKLGKLVQFNSVQLDIYKRICQQRRIRRTVRQSALGITRLLVPSDLSLLTFRAIRSFVPFDLLAHLSVRTFA